MPRFRWLTLPVAVVSLVFAATLLLSYDAARLSAIASSSSGNQTEFALKSTTQYETAGPLLMRESKVSIDYPTAMLEGESPFVKCTYSVRNYTSGGIPRHFPGFPDLQRTVSTDPPPRVNEAIVKLDTNIKLLLTATAFEIKPTEEAVFRKGDDLPSQCKWLIEPKELGTFNLLLRVQDGADNEKPAKPEGGTKTVDQTSGDETGRRFRVSDEARINGEVVHVDASGYYELPVTVKSIFFLSRRQVYVWGAIAGAIGGGSLLALLVSIYKWFFPNRRRPIGFGTSQKKVE